MRQPYLRYFWILLAAAALVLVAGELFARLWVLPRGSRILSRIQHEKQIAAHLTPADVLIVGNSLLNEGVDPEIYAQGMAPQWRARRFVVESSSHLDWYYGLKNLLAQGSRPHSIAIMLSPRQLETPEVLKDHFGAHLLGLRDAPSVVLETGMHPTDATSMLFSHFSAFYGARQDIRKVLLYRFFPGLPDLTALSVPPPLKPMTSEQAYRAALPALRRFRQLAGTFPVRVVLILPPVRVVANDGNLEALRAGQEAGFPVLLPVPSKEVPVDHFSDGFHLNAQGRALFTPRLVAAWKSYLSRPAPEASH